MTSSSTSDLRIFCICGQKMKVSPAMFGRPGRCVACGQKIRIPRPDEAPENAAEIHLKDHPEFLRKNRRRKPKPGRAEPRPARPGRARSGPPHTLPLDTLEPLAVLCSIKHKIKRKLLKLEKQQGAAADRTALEERLAKAREARNELDEALRQRLMEIAIDLSHTQEQIAEAGLSVRVGETDFATYRSAVDKLRRRRDQLERRQQNIRGWLAVQDPYYAGGYRDLPIDALPKDCARPVLPADPEPGGRLLDRYVESLRLAFERREQAERKRDELNKLASNETSPRAEIEHERLERQAQAALAEAAIKFYRGRLEQMDSDYAGDSQAISAQMDQIRGRLQTGDLDRAEFNRLERDFRVAKNDFAKAHQLIARALTATRSQDVPLPRGTFLQRLAKAGQEPLGLDSWVAHGASLALFLSLLAPIFLGSNEFRSAWRQLSDTQTSVWALIACPFIGGVILAAAAAIPYRLIRGTLIFVIGLTLALAGAWLLQDLRFSPGAAARLVQSEGIWRVSVAIYYLGLMGAAIATIMAFLPIRPLRHAAVAGVAAAAVITGAIGTDSLGFTRPRPEVSIHLQASAADITDELRELEVTVSNRGRRPFTLAADAQGRDEFMLTLERQVLNGWQKLGAPDAARVGDSEQAPVKSGLQRLTVPPNQSVSLRWYGQAEPGRTYRATLRSPGEFAPAAQAEYRVEGERHTETPAQPEPPAVTPGGPADTGGLAASPPQQTPPATDTPAPTPSAAAPLTVPEVELRGLVGAAGQAPRFSINIYFPDGRTEKLTLSLGDVVYREWSVAEYNEQQRTVTLSDGADYLVLRGGGQRLALSGR